MKRLILFLICLVALSTAEEPPFSGKTRVYEDSANKWSITLNEEFTQQGEGQHVYWAGPVLDGGGASVHMNITDFPGVSYQQLYDINAGQLKNKKEYTDLRGIKVGKWPGISYKEVGTGKKPDDIHRWHVEVYAGNGPGGQTRIYSMVLGGAYASFTSTLPPVFNAAIKSLAVK